MIKKNYNLKFVIRNCSSGMTLVELIVVVGIFAIISAVSVYNYSSFQSKVDIKNLASDIALQVVTAQKSAISGVLPSSTQQLVIPPSPFSWKPAYGVYFSANSTLDKNGGDNKDFIYFTDLNDDTQFDGLTCDGSKECISKYTITKSNYISDISAVYASGATTALGNLTITFARPNSGAVVVSDTFFSTSPMPSYFQITISSSASAGATISTIKLYTSGRIQIN